MTKSSSSLPIQSGSYEITDKGFKYLEDPLIYTEKFSEDFAILNILMGPGPEYSPRNLSDRDRPALSRLLRKGFIKLVSKDEASIFRDIESLPRSSVVREVLLTYAKVAFEKPVSTSEIDNSLHSYSLMIEKHVRGLPKEVRAEALKPHSANLKKISKATTRTDKVLALDSIVSELHSRGFRIVDPEYEYVVGGNEVAARGGEDVYERNLKLNSKVNNILNRLFEGPDSKD